MRGGGLERLREGGAVGAPAEQMQLERAGGQARGVFGEGARQRLEGALRVAAGSRGFAHPHPQRGGRRTVHAASELGS
jgi:hypothetical protein